MDEEKERRVSIGLWIDLDDETGGHSKRRERSTDEEKKILRDSIQGWSRRRCWEGMVMGTEWEAHNVGTARRGMNLS